MSQDADRTVTTSVAEPLQYLTFMLGGETFAIGILATKEIIEYHGLTTVPMMPACVRGVINLRGAVVPVVDLAARFLRDPSKATRRTCIVIVEVEGDAGRQDVGVIVDAVNEVIDIPACDVEPVPALGTSIRSEFIRGMGKVNGRFVILLDPKHVLSVDELATLTEAAEPLAA